MRSLLFSSFVLFYLFLFDGEMILNCIYLEKALLVILLDFSCCYITTSLSFYKLKQLLIVIPRTKSRNCVVVVILLLSQIPTRCALYSIIALHQLMTSQAINRLEPKQLLGECGK